ncbi:hypothetical protein AAG906_027331 [Vitis piasezkii]
MNWLKSQYPRQSKRQIWLQEEHIVEEAIHNGQDISNTLRWLAHGPTHQVVKYPGYIINGCRYHTKERDMTCVTQNSGVSILAGTMQIASSKDKNPVFGELCFYGVINEIWDLDYNMFRIPIFKCDWVDNKNGIKVDELGFTLVDFSKIGHKSDPFILASQAKQVFYVEDQLDPKWSIVLSIPPKDFNNMEGLDDFTDNFESFDVMDESDAIYMREDCLLVKKVPKETKEKLWDLITSIGRVDRSVLWKKACEKKGKFNKITEPLINMIDELLENAKETGLPPPGPNDILGRIGNGKKRKCCCNGTLIEEKGSNRLVVINVAHKPNARLPFPNPYEIINVGKLLALSLTGQQALSYLKLNIPRYVLDKGKKKIVKTPIIQKSKPQNHSPRKMIVHYLDPMHHKPCEDLKDIVNM